MDRVVDRFVLYTDLENKLFELVLATPCPTCGKTNVPCEGTLPTHDPKTAFCAARTKAAADVLDEAIARQRGDDDPHAWRAAMIDKDLGF